MDEVLYTAYLKGNLRLSKTGEWWHNGRPFQNEKLSGLFHRAIRWVEAEKQYFVYIGGGRAAFDVEDTAYFVIELILDSSSPSVLLADGSTEFLELDSLSTGDDNQIYCTVKGSHRARFSRAAHQVLLQSAVDESHVLLQGKRILLRRTS